MSSANQLCHEVVQNTSLSSKVEAVCRVSIGIALFGFVCGEIGGKLSSI
jgi:hypothetical protein